MTARSASARWPRALRAPLAAQYVGASESTFREWVSRGLMPTPHRPPDPRSNMVVWFIEELDEYLDRFTKDGQPANDDWRDVAL